MSINDSTMIAIRYLYEMIDLDCLLHSWPTVIRVHLLLEKKNSYTTFRNGIVHRKICILFSFVEKIIDFLFVSKIGHVLYFENESTKINLSKRKLSFTFNSPPLWLRNYYRNWLMHIVELNGHTLIIFSFYMGQSKCDRRSQRKYLSSASAK